jgi:DNA polymerase IIIc chi subunit
MTVYLPVNVAKPIAKFYYKGSHSHPIRRTVLVLISNKESFTGFELREGSIVRKLSKAPIKAYARDKIATYRQLGLCKHREAGPAKTTLRKLKAIEVLFNGV